MAHDALTAAAKHLDRTTNPGEGHRYVADPQPHATAAGVSIVRFGHEYRGIPVFLESVAVHVAADGEIVRGSAVAEPRWTAGIVPDLSAAAAIEHSGAHFRTRQRDGSCRVPHRALLARRVIDAEPLTSFPLPSRPTVFATRKAAIAAQLVFVVTAGAPQLCWLVRLPTGAAGTYLTAVAATGNEAGTVIFCAPWSASVRCRGTVFRNNPNTPRVTIDFPQPISTFPSGFAALPDAQLLDDWMTDASIAGNFVEMFLANASSTLKAVATPKGLEFTAAANPLGIEQALLNAFFLCNYLHDFFLLLGFGEAEGNFQLVNRTGKGKAGDRLRVRIFDSVNSTLGSMEARDDGKTAELKLFKSPAKRFAALDADVVIHEYAHGVSHRIVGGRLGFDSLLEEQSIAVDEGWSDYFAVTIQNALRDTPDVFSFASWTTNSTGLRTAPYDTHYPGKYGDLGTKPYTKPIAAAEVWAMALIRMNELFGAELGRVRGHEVGWSAVVESMKHLEDPNPTFVQARNAVFDALGALRAGGSITASDFERTLPAARQAFRERGLGAQASSTGKKLRDARGDST